MLAIDLTGKRALIAGVSDDGGFGFAIARSLAEAGATIVLGSWPPALGIFTKLLERGKIEESMQMSGGRRLEFEKIYPLDAAFDTMADVPAEIRENKRYKDQGDFTIEGLITGVKRDFGGASLDIVVHSLANGPEVRKPLVDTSRRGYLEAVSVSAYSNIAMVRGLAPLMRPGGSFLSLTYMAGERVIRDMVAACRPPRRRSRPIPARSPSRPAGAGGSASTPSAPAPTPRARRAQSGSLMR